MAEYDYTKTVEPDIEQLWVDIEASAMTNKSQEGATWDEDSELLKCLFTNDLDAADKTILDGIVAALPDED